MLSHSLKHITTSILLNVHVSILQDDHFDDWFPSRKFLDPLLMLACLALTLWAELPYLFDYNAQNFELIFRQKSLLRVIHEV